MSNISINNLPVNIQNALRSLSTALFSAPFNATDPLDKMSVNEVTELQKFLEEVKADKIRKIQNILLHDYGYHNTNSQPYNPQIISNYETTTKNGSLPRSTGTPAGPAGSNRKAQQNFMNNIPTYYNPYEYDSKQNNLPSQYYEPYLGEYHNDSEMLDAIGASSKPITNNNKNINIESGLLHSETSRTRSKTSNEIDRFNYLPFDPQDPSHIVWNDGMPRGGFPTRNNKLQY